MKHSMKLFGLFVILCVLVVNIQGRPQDMVASSTEKSTWDKIKDSVKHGLTVAYGEVHCEFHKVKGLVSDHTHEKGSDPCNNKPYQQKSTPPSIDLRIEDIVPITSTSSPPYVNLRK